MDHQIALGRDAVPVRRRIRRGALVLALIFLGGCDSPTSPGVGLQVTNAVDNFQYQVTSVQNYSNVAGYVWQNTGSTANVNQASTVIGGSMTVVLLDNAGTQVYSRSLADNGTFVTSTGVPGAWTIRVIYTGASGTVNFRVQKP